MMLKKFQNTNLYYFHVSTTSRDILFSASIIPRLEFLREHYNKRRYLLWRMYCVFPRRETIYCLKYKCYDINSRFKRPQSSSAIKKPFILRDILCSLCINVLASCEKDLNGNKMWRCKISIPFDAEHSALRFSFTCSFYKWAYK